MAARHRGVGLAETLEHVGDEVGTDAGAVVADRDRHLFVAPADLDRDQAVARGELDRVRQQVAQHLHQAVMVDRGLHPFGARRQVEAQRHAGLARLALHRLGRVPQHRRQRLHAAPVFHLTRLDLLDVEQIVHHPHQAVAALAGDVQQLGHVRRQFAGHAGVEQRQRGVDRGERRAQLVRDGGHELALHALDLLALGDVVQEDAEEGVLALARQRHRGLDREFRALAVDHDPFQAPVIRKLAALVEPAQRLGDAGAVALRQDHLGQRPADRLVAAPAEHALGGRIPVEDHAALVDRDEGVLRHPDDGGDALLAGAHRGQRALQFQGALVDPLFEGVVQRLQLGAPLHQRRHQRIERARQLAHLGVAAPRRHQLLAVAAAQAVGRRGQGLQGTRDAARQQQAGQREQQRQRGAAPQGACAQLAHRPVGVLEVLAHQHVPAQARIVAHCARGGVADQVVAPVVPALDRVAGAPLARLAQAGQVDPGVLQAFGPQQHHAFGADDQCLHPVARLHRRDDRALDVARPLPRQVGAQHTGRLAVRIQPGKGHVDEAARLAFLHRQQLGQQHRLVHVADVGALERIDEPRPLGHVLPFQQAARLGQHRAVQGGHADPFVVAVGRLHVAQDPAPLGMRGAGGHQVAAARHQPHLAIALDHAAIELVGGLHRHLAQPAADAALDLVGGGALDHLDQQQGQDHGKRRERKGEPGAKAARRRAKQKAGEVWHAEPEVIFQKRITALWPLGNRRLGQSCVMTTFHSACMAGAGSSFRQNTRCGEWKCG